MTVERISNGVWLVERNGRRREVILPAGRDNEADALAVVAEIENGPSVQQRAAWAAMQRQEKCKAECQRRIEEVLGPVSGKRQLNMMASAAAGMLTADDRVLYRAGVEWVMEMRRRWRLIYHSNADPTDDSNWPTVPDKVAAFAAQF